MEIKKVKNHKKPILIVAAVLVAFLIILALYLTVFKGNILGWAPFATTRDNSINYDKPTEDQIRAGKDIEKSTAENSNSGENPNDVGSDHPEKPVTTPGETKATVAVSISAANQNDGVLQVRTLIGSLTNDGTCTLTLTKDGKTVTKTAGVQAQSNASTCKGFDIPVSELSVGQWQATIKYESSMLTGEGQSMVKVI